MEVNVQWVVKPHNAPYLLIGTASQSTRGSCGQANHEVNYRYQGSFSPE